MQAAKKPIVVVGSINIDLVANTKRIPVAGETVTGQDFQIHPGGKGANQAVAAARLGYPVRMIGRVGDDAFGSQLRTGLETAGVETASVITTPGCSGVAVIVVAESGENSIVVVPGANAQVTPDDIDANIDIIRSAGMVLAQLEIPIETILHLASICSQEGVPLMLDPAPARELPNELFQHVTWFTPNETEAAFYIGNPAGAANADAKAEALGEIAGSLLLKGIQGVVLKLGSHGAYLASPKGLAERIQPFPVHAVDTTAAGDCFNGAFAVGLLLGKDPAQSARFAAAAAAISVTRPGAQPSMPVLAEVEQMLAGEKGSAVDL
jgi:ribokinase